MPVDTANGQDSVRFAASVPANDSVTETWEVPRDLTVEELQVRIYRGAELSLEVEPFVDRDRDPDSSRREALLNFQGKQFVDGDGDTFVFPLSTGVQDGEFLGVEVTNTASSYSYDFAVDMAVDYAGGVERLIRRVR